MTQTPRSICEKWVKRIGLGFHPDTRGADYAPALSASEIAEYDADMDTLFGAAFGAAADPYADAVDAMQQHILFEALASAQTLDEASTAYQAYLRAEGLPQMSADELLAEDVLSASQRRAVEQFSKWWSNAQ